MFGFGEDDGENINFQNLEFLDESKIFCGGILVFQEFLKIAYVVTLNRPVVKLAPGGYTATGSSECFSNSMNFSRLPGQVVHLPQFHPSSVVYPPCILGKMVAKAKIRVKSGFEDDNPMKKNLFLNIFSVFIRLSRTDFTVRL